MMYKLNIERSPVLNTKWGRAKRYADGHYLIKSGKEGNNGKHLHRVIFEDFYRKIPDGCEVHHIDHNPSNNCIMNLQLLTKPAHRRLHMTGENNPSYGGLSEEHCKKISERMSGENHPLYGRTGENNPKYNYIPTIQKAGFKNKKQKYKITLNSKSICTSINKPKIDNYYRAILFNFKYKYFNKEE